MSDGPYCPNCGTYLGRGYTKGDECLECFEEREESAEAWTKNRPRRVPMPATLTSTKIRHAQPTTR